MFSIKSLLLTPDQDQQKSRPSILNISSLLSPEPEICSYNKDIDYFERKQQQSQQKETDLSNETIWQYKYHPDPYHQHHYHQHQRHQPYYNPMMKQNEPYRKSSMSSIGSYSLYSPPSSKCGSGSSSEEDEHQQQYRPANKLHRPLKAKRRRTSSQQLATLNSVFERTFFPSTQVRMELACQLGMSPRTVQIWFQNKRQAMRTKQRSDPKADSSRESSASFE